MSGFPHQNRQGGAGDRVGDREGEEAGADRPENARERDHREGSIQQEESEGDGRGGEGPDILGDVLIRILDQIEPAEMKVGALFKVIPEQLPGLPFPPKQGEPLFRESEPGGGEREDGKDREVGPPQRSEARTSRCSTAETKSRPT